MPKIVIILYLLLSDIEKNKMTYISFYSPIIRLPNNIFQIP